MGFMMKKYGVLITFLSQTAIFGKTEEPLEFEPKIDFFKPIKSYIYYYYV
jgi:hypothetical protein